MLNCLFWVSNFPVIVLTEDGTNFRSGVEVRCGDQTINNLGCSLDEMIEKTR